MSSVFYPSLPVHFCPFPNPVSVLYCLCNVHQSSKIQADAYETLVTNLLRYVVTFGLLTPSLYSHTSSYAYPNRLSQDDSSASSNSTEMSGGDAVAESSTTGSLVVEFKEGSSGHRYDNYA